MNYALDCEFMEDGHVIELLSIAHLEARTGLRCGEAGANPMSQDITVIDWRPGMQALYVPSHAQGNLSHPAVERGIVTSVNDQWVFVRFGSDATSKACRPEDLR